MSLQTLIEQTPAWAKLTITGAMALGGWLGTIEYRINDSAKKADVKVMQTAITGSMLTKDDFHEYMLEFSKEWKKDVQRLEDKIDDKADK